MDDDEELVDFGPQTKTDFRKAEVAKFKNSKKPKKLVKQNRHRWQSFNERLDGVQVDVLRRTGHDSKRGITSLLDEGFDEDFGSHFEAQLAKWGELNLTADFTGFLRDVQSKIGSLALVLHNKDVLMDALLQRLTAKRSLAIKPLCACMAALARDLRQEFYPYLQPRVLPVLFQLLDVQDAEQLEDVFSCIAFLFKFLLRFVIDDFVPIFDLMFPLLGHKHWYIRKFSAEVVSFLIRKVPAESVREALAHVLAAAVREMTGNEQESASVYAMATKRKQVKEGVSEFLFEAVKGVQNGFHSRYAMVASNLVDLAAAVPSGSQGKRAACERRAVVSSFFARVCEHCRAEQADLLWSTFNSILDRNLLALETSQDDTKAAPRQSLSKRKRGAEEGDAVEAGSCGAAAECLGFMAAAVAHRGGSRLGDAHVPPLMARLNAALHHAVGLVSGDKKEDGKCFGGGGSGRWLMQNVMALGASLLLHADPNQIEDSVDLWSDVLQSGSRDLALDAALRLCQAGCAQGALRSTLWNLCSCLSEHDLVAAMVLYDALVKDTAHESNIVDNVRAAAAVRARVVAALGAKLGVTAATALPTAGEWDAELVRWLWLAVRVVGATEGSLMRGDVEVDKAALGQLLALVQAAARSLQAGDEADAVHKEKQGRRGRGGGGSAAREHAGSDKQDREAMMVEERRTQVAALAGSCRHIDEAAALLVEALRALVAVCQSALLSVRAKSETADRKKASKAEGSKSALAKQEQDLQRLAETGIGEATAVAHVLLDKLPHSTATLGFLLEWLEADQEGLTTSSITREAKPAPITFEAAYDKLRTNLLTADEGLRRATLRLWLLLLPRSSCDAEDGAGYDLFATNAERATVEVMLGVEEAPMDAIHGKARILRLQQLQTAVQSGKIPERMRSALVPFYIGQFRTRFTLPWKQMREGLAAMAAHLPAHLWPGLLAHASICVASVNFSLLRPSLDSSAEFDGVEGEDNEAQEEDEGDEDEDDDEAGDDDDDDDGEARDEAKVKKSKGKAGKRASRVPKAVKVRLRRLSGRRGLHERLVGAVRAHEFSGTPQVDVVVQLLTAAASDAKHLQNHSKYLVQEFLRFVALTYDALFSEDQEILDNEDLVALGLDKMSQRLSGKKSHEQLKAAGKKSRYQELPTSASAAMASTASEAASGGALVETVETGMASLGRSDATRVLAAFLQVFANMSSSEPLFQRAILHKVFYALLAKPHNQVQLLSLRCLYLWKPLAILPYKDNLENLIDDERYRDEITFFSLDEELGQVKEDHRGDLIPVATRILYAKLVQRKVTAAKTSLAQRRATVLAFFGALRTEEFGELVSIVFRPFLELSGGADANALETDAAVLAGLNSKKLLGFLNTLKDLIDQVGHLLVCHLPRITSTLLAMVAHVFSSGSACDAEEAETVDDEDAVPIDELKSSVDHREKLLKKLRGLCLRRVTDIVTKFKTSDLSGFLPRLLDTLMPRVRRLPCDNTQSPVGLLETFHEMAHNVNLAAYLFTRPDLLPSIFACMSAPNAAFPVRQASLEIAQVLVREAQALGLQTKMSSHMSVLLDHVYKHLKIIVDKGGPQQASAGDPQAQIREVRLLRLQFDLLAELSKYSPTPQQARQLLDLLIPFLGNRKKFGNVSASNEARTFILRTCANLVGVVADSSVYVPAAARQLLPAMPADARAAVCEWIAAIGKPLAKVAGCVADLNAMSSTRLDEYDFDKRLAAYSGCCRAGFLGQLNALHLRVLAAQCMHDLRDPDVSIRNHSIKLITLILGHIKEAATCEGGAATSAAGGGHTAGQMIGTAQGKGAAEWEVYLDVIYSALKKNLGDSKREIRHEAFKLIIKAASEFTEFHSDLAGLTHVDPEQDISLNLLHIQMHRRIKALVSLQKVVEGGTLTPTSLRYILMPLVWWNMIEPQDKDGGGKAYKADDGAYNLADEAVRTAGAIALQLPWKDYHVMVWDALRHLSLQRPYEKILVKHVCALIANFHFELDASGEAHVSHYSHILGVTDTPMALMAAAAAAPQADADADSKRRHSQAAQRLDTGDDDDDDDQHDAAAEQQEGVSAAMDAPLPANAGVMEVGADDVDLKRKIAMQELGSGKTGQPADIYVHVVYKLMPELEKHMTERVQTTAVDKRVQQGKLRPGMAVAVVKMLKLLPEERMRARLPHIIGVVCNGLRVREQGDRDATRKTLADMMRCLGPMFLHFVLGEVKSNLSVGYQRHVCGYTFYSILESLQDMLVGACLAPSLPLILQVFLSELHGTVAEEKEVDKIVAKTREAKSSKAYDCMELVGKVLSFDLLTSSLLEPEDHEWGLRAHIHAAASLKQRKKMEEMLRRLGLGLAANPSVSAYDMLVWVHGQVDHYLPACVPANKKSKLELKEAQRKQAADQLGVGGGAVGEAGQKRSRLLEKRPEPAEKLAPMGPEWERRCRAREGASLLEASADDAANVNRNEYLLAELALLLLHTCLKRDTVDLKVQRNLEMLDPFVGVTQKLMLSKHDSIVVLALKIFALLLQIHLPSLGHELPWVLKNIFFLLQRGGSTSSLTMQACFKALTVLLREAKGKVMLSQSQLKVLLSFAKQDICESGRQAVAFGLVRAIIARKLVCEEVYDLVDRISEHMVTSQSEQTRALSAQTLIQFILEFPMGDKRLHLHVTSLVRNLDYGYESGRKIVLEVMARIAAKLPPPVIQQYLELLFLPLVPRLVNDDSTTCRKMVGLLIKDLLGRAQRKQLDTLLDLVLEWSAGADALLRRAAAQVLGLLVEQQGSAAERYMERVLGALAQSVSISLESQEAHGEWECVYQLLTAAEKLHGACSQLTQAPTYLQHTGGLLGARVAQHRHPWVQLAAARLLGRALGAVDPEAAGGAGLRKLLNACGGCFNVVRGICAQVARGDLDEGMSQQLLRNLVHLSTALHRNRKLVKDAEVDAASADEEEEEEAQLGNGVEDGDARLDGSDGSGDGGEAAAGQGTSASPALRGGAAAAGEDGGDVIEPVRAVKWLFQRLSHIARRHNSHRRSCVFQFFAAMAVRMGKAAIVPLLPQIATPLFRAVETDTESSREDSCKDLAQEVMEVLQGVAGHDRFFSAYNACRSRQKVRKEQRRSEKTLKKLLDPQGAAAARIGKNQRKIKAKKRKLEAYKEERGAKRLQHEREDL